MDKSVIIHFLAESTMRLHTNNT